MLVVSHSDICEGSRDDVVGGTSGSDSSMTASQRMGKEKVFKDVTDVLDIRPIKFKPSSTGPRGAGGKAVKEVCPISQWVSIKAQSPLGDTGPVGHDPNRTKGGPMLDRPPDVSRSR